MDKLKKLMQEVLIEGVLLSLGTYDGEVWVSDVLYVADSDSVLYWRSFESTRHSKAIEKNRGVQISGHAEKISDIPDDIYKKYLLKRGKNPDGGRKNAPGESWYKLIS